MPRHTQADLEGSENIEPLAQPAVRLALERRQIGQAGAWVQQSLDIGVIVQAS
ncbi:hypothetical protein D3C80_1857170 [compost metagenome]